MSNATLALTGLLVLGAPTLAGDLDRSLVPLQTPFLVHVDVQGLLATRLAQAALEAAGDDLLEETDLAAIGELGIDPFRDIHSVTLFSVDGSLDHGVALVEASSAVDRALELLVEQGKLRAFTHGGLRMFGVEGESAAVYVGEGASGDTRRVLLSDDADDVVKAAAVLSGDARNLAQARPPRLGSKPLAGAFLVLEVGDVLDELTEGSPASQVGGKAKGFSFQVGESRGRLFLRAELEANDGESAEMIGNVLVGLRSLMSLTGGAQDLPPLVSDLIEGIDVSVSGTRIRLDLELDSQHLIEQLRELEEEF